MSQPPRAVDLSDTLKGPGAGAVAKERDAMRDIEAMIQPVLNVWNELRRQEGSSDAVYATLREAILSKAIHSGQQISEEDLAQAFGVSRTPIREAVLRLESEHLVIRRGRRGLLVSEISPEEVLEIYDVRIALDALAAKLAAEHVTPPMIAQLRWVNERMVAAGDAEEFDQMATLNLEFHDWLAKASHNSFLQVQLQSVHDRVRRFDTTTFGYPGRWKAVVEEHEAILAALESGDPTRAERAARTHMANAKKVRLAMVEERPEA